MRAAFASLVDYAGLFPPAGLGMPDAVREYDRERRGPDRWMLGRFVVAASRLEELGTAIESEGLHIARHDPWRVSAVMGVHLPDELSRVNAFRAAWESRGVTVDALEFKVSSVGQLLTVAEQIPAAYQRFFEVPHEGPYGALVAAIGRVGAFAKVRTGGTTAELFPAPDQLTAFLIAATGQGVRFKATAGLHHPYRGQYRLTYEAEAASGWMYGFVNLLVATTLLLRSGDGEAAQAVLEAVGAESFQRDEDGIRVLGHHCSWDELASARERAFTSFGSCSFREPVDELGLPEQVA
jgi:hypothetical protein